MKKNIVLALMVLFCFVLQTTLFKELGFGGISPNLMIIVTAAYGFMYGINNGIAVGFASGLLIDIFCGDVIGFYALIYLYIGAANGIFHSVFYQDGIKLPLALIMASDFIYGCICYILLFLLRGRFNIGYYMKNVIMPEVVYTVFISIFLYPLILFLNRSIEDSERGDSNIV